ncbi:putative sucrose-specific phosphotransferase system (PTS)%2C IIABC component [Streptococcus pneumoniae]|nr:putative sucrose-specific phosphotransferase system (PTS)%2C IIABC component [Streptococcus pneumoniae]
MNNQEIAKKVIDALGGRENVNSVAHCATRLRVMVKDEEKINKEVIENLEKVQGAYLHTNLDRYSLHHLARFGCVVNLPCIWWKSCRWYRSWYDACLWLTSKRLGSCSRW